MDGRTGYYKHVTLDVRARGPVAYSQQLLAILEHAALGTHLRLEHDAEKRSQSFRLATWTCLYTRFLTLVSRAFAPAHLPSR